MKYSEVGKFGNKRLRKERYKKIGKALVLCIVIGALFFAALTYMPELSALYE